MNLCINARDAMPAGGELSITAREVGGEAARAEVVVQDTGTGIAPDVLAQIFEPFFTTKRDAKLAGTGVGLFTSKRIVERHGGSLAVSTEVGRGTTLTISLPLLRASVPPSVGTTQMT